MTIHPRYKRQKRSKRSYFQKLVFWLLSILIIAALIVGFFIYRAIFKPNVWTGEKEYISVYIPTGSDFDDVKTILYSQGIIEKRGTFEWLSRKKKYDRYVKPGHYIITQGMSNDELINLLRSGNQTPVNVIFNSARSVNAIAGVVEDQIEADSASVMDLLQDSVFLASLGLSPKDAILLFIPNTYEMWWTTTARQFLNRMYIEYQAFWNEERRSKAGELGMSLKEVITLASIVEKETNKHDEKATIAGVYINRLKKGWKLQADPTLIYALQDYSIRRVLNDHKKIESPYNTYKYKGLPPGPICIPGIPSIESVLNHEQHNYMFFCASSDMSGYHTFARTVTEHNRNARAYQRALDEMRVYK
jgi:UPF0755 protein